MQGGYDKMKTWSAFVCCRTPWNCRRSWHWRRMNWSVLRWWISILSSLLYDCGIFLCRCLHVALHYLHLATSGGRGRLTELSLCYSIVYYYNGAQRYEQLLQVGRLIDPW